MNSRKKIISIVIKTLVGIASFLIVYFRLRNDLTPQNQEILSAAFFSGTGFFCLMICLILIPINWGIESFKWQLITAPIEKINFRTAQRSVYSGICLGNLAPGRATEFLAKIIFFKPENRPQITVLHFVNGMFQLSVTYLIGFMALVYKLKSFGEDNIWIAYVSITSAVIVIGIFLTCLIKIDKVLNFVSKKIAGQKQLVNFEYHFTKLQLIKLFSASAIRYFVFFLQIILLIYLFGGTFNFNVLTGAALYFLITTTIPMISFIEAAIRAAIALVVFKDSGISNAALALASVTVWLFNIIIPSVYGYFILLRQNFDFKLSASKK